MKVILQINPEFFAFAEAMAKNGGYFGPADYLNALLNMALITEMDSAPVLTRCEDETLLVEDDGGGMRLADIDDDIPF